MTKDYLLYQIRQKKRELERWLTEKKTLEEKLEALDEFAAECESHIKSFENSMTRRRQRLSGVSSLLGRARAALLYSQRMSGALQGRDYTNTINSIDSLRSSVSDKRKVVMDDLIEAERRIDYLRYEIHQLQYQYDHFPEEDENDG